MFGSKTRRQKNALHSIGLNRKRFEVIKEPILSSGLLGPEDSNRYNPIFDALNTQSEEINGICLNYSMRDIVRRGGSRETRRQTPPPDEHDALERLRSASLHMAATCNQLINRLTEDALPALFYYDTGLIAAKEQAADLIKELKVSEAAGMAENYRHALILHGKLHSLEAVKTESFDEKSAEDIVQRYIVKHDNGSIKDADYFRSILDKRTFEQHIADEPEEVHPYLKKLLLLSCVSTLKNLASEMAQCADDALRQQSSAKTR